MIIIQEVLLSDAIIEEEFMCNLNACKGACCWEGDYGAPLEDDEIEILQQEYPKIAPFLREEGRQMIEKVGVSTFFKKEQDSGTPLLENGACSYLSYGENGIAKCGIEEAHQAGATTFKKPISCHLYPIRVKKSAPIGYELMNYDRWDICAAACTLGKKLKMPVFQFAKEALIRKYGIDFFAELEAVAQELKKG